MMTIEMPTLKKYLKSRSTKKDYKKLFKKALAIINKENITIREACERVGISHETYRKYKKARR